MLRLEPRSTQSFAAAWLSPVMALVLTAITGGVIFLAMGKGGKRHPVAHVPCPRKHFPNIGRTHCPDSCKALVP